MHRLLFIILVTTMISCNSASPDAGTEPRLSIEHHAGDMLEDSDFLPYPTHYGKIDDDHVLLLTKAGNPGSARSIHPIAMMRTNEGGQEVNWIVANDAHDDFKIKDLETVDDLMTKHNGIKATLERWIINRKGIGQVMLKGWKEAPDLDQSNNQ